MVEMGVIGAALLRRQFSAIEPSGHELYVATGLGELVKNNALFLQVLPPADGLASPFDFINSSANTTAFYVARDWGFNGRNLTLSADDFSYEVALQHALSDLKARDCTSAMIGGIDEFLGPRELHLDRLGIPETSEAILGEGCGWLALDRNPDGAIGQITSVFEFQQEFPGDVQDWIQQFENSVAEIVGAAESCVVLPGFGIDPDVIAGIETDKPEWGIWNYLELCGRYPTASAFGIAASLEADAHSGKTMVHVNRDAFGKSIGVIYKRFS